MAEPRYIYDIDDHPPVKLAALYGLQWAIIAFPSFIIMATLASQALNLSLKQEVHFLQLLLLISGFFSALQTLWGHRYPVLDGPSTALLLTFIILAPYGVQTIQGGTIFGGALLIGLVLSGQLTRAVAFATPNVVGVILMLIAFTLLPYLARTMMGSGIDRSEGSVSVFLISIALVLMMAAFSHWLSGFWKTLSLLLGMLVGTIVFSLMGFLDWQQLRTAAWVSLPRRWSSTLPGFYWPGLIAFGSAYLALLVNSLGSLNGIANITDTERLPDSISRGIFLNGLGGVVSGLLGIVGTVSYSFSPGVVLANRVASRFTITYCGVVLILAAFIPKLAALLAVVPLPVVGAALCVAMGAQIGAALSIITSGGITSRDYFVVGLPVLLGTMVGFLPDSFMASMPGAFRVFLGNGLIVGIFLVLLLEHVLLRARYVRRENQR